MYSDARPRIVRRKSSGTDLLSVIAVVRSLWSHGYLAWETAKRELLAINKGTMLGLGWLVLRPGLQALTYVVVVSFVFSVKFGSSGSHLSYALYVLSGMAPWQITARVFEDSPTLIRARIEMLKQIVYPLEILPITSIVLAAVGPLILVGIYLVLALIAGELHWTVIFLPFAMALLGILLLGAAWVFMVIGLVLIDLREIVGVVFGLLVYLSPVVLAQSMVSARIWHFIQLNPMSHIVICFRDVFDAQFHPLSWAIFGGMAVIAFLIGSFALPSARQIFSEYA
jgi:lipopolysaccharide transport system permease protein